MHHFSRSHRSSFGCCLAIVRDETALQICLHSTSMFHQGYPSTALTLSTLKYKIHLNLCSKGSFMPHFSSAWIVIWVLFWLLFVTKWRCKYVCAPAQCIIKDIQGILQPFSSLKYKIHLISCSKGSFMHHFRGRTDRHFGSVWLFVRNEMALQIQQNRSSMYHQSYPSTALTFFEY